MIKKKIKQIACDLRSVANVDFMDMSFIAESVREDLGVKDEESLRFCTMEVIRCLMAMDVFPGDYDHAATMSFWAGMEGELMNRIEVEWIAMGRTPTLEHPICWFGIRKFKSV